MKPATVEAMAFRGEPAAEMLDISMISPWTNNPRRTIDPERLRELADSIGKVGVLRDPCLSICLRNLARAMQRRRAAQ